MYKPNECLTCQLKLQHPDFTAGRSMNSNVTKCEKWSQLRSHISLQIYQVSAN